MDSFGLHIFPENFHLKRGVFLALSTMIRHKLPLRAECIWYYFEQVSNEIAFLALTVVIVSQQ